MADAHAFAALIKRAEIAGQIGHMRLNNLGVSTTFVSARSRRRSCNDPALETIEAIACHPLAIASAAVRITAHILTPATLLRRQPFLFDGLRKRRSNADRPLLAIDGHAAVFRRAVKDGAWSHGLPSCCCHYLPAEGEKVETG